MCNQSCAVTGRTIPIDGAVVDPMTSVRDLGILNDADLTIRTHVQRTTSQRFAVLRHLRQIRHMVPSANLQTLVVVLILSRPDYGNGVLFGLPAYLVRRLQSVLNASARLSVHLRLIDPTALPTHYSRSTHSR